MYQSPSQHYHPGAVNGIPGTAAIFGDLCRECYLQDFAKVYPKEKLPNLPKDVIDSEPSKVGFTHPSLLPPSETRP
jgi:hypothetical protein